MEGKRESACHLCQKKRERELFFECASLEGPLGLTLGSFVEWAKPLFPWANALAYVCLFFSTMCMLSMHKVEVDKHIGQGLSPWEKGLSPLHKGAKGQAQGALQRGAFKKSSLSLSSFGTRGQHSLSSPSTCGLA